MRNLCAASFFQPLYALHLLGHISSSPDLQAQQTDQSLVLCKGHRNPLGDSPDLQGEGTRLFREMQNFSYISIKSLFNAINLPATSLS
ncbi:unnamed protein product [Ixodes hexagonus]